MDAKKADKVYRSRKILTSRLLPLFGTISVGLMGLCILFSIGYLRYYKLVHKQDLQEKTNFIRKYYTSEAAKIDNARMLQLIPPPKETILKIRKIWDD